MASVHLELSPHINSFREERNVVNRIVDGDYSASIWPKNVTSRAQRYSPDAVLSDSCDPLLFAFDDVNAGLKVATRAFMPPLLPELLKRPVSLIAGDSLFWSDRVSEENLDWLQAIKILGLSVGVGATAELIDKHYKNFSIQQIPRKHPTDASDTSPEYFSSRRKFLSKFATLGTGLYLAGKFAPLVISRSSTHSLDSLARISDLTNFFRTETTYTRWLDGRTALMIQKAIEFAQINDADVGVLVGDGHQPRSSEFLKDKNSRINALSEFASLMLSQIIKVTKNESINSVNALLQNFMLSFAGIRVFTVPPSSIAGIKEIEFYYSEEILEIYNNCLIRMT